MSKYNLDEQFSKLSLKQITNMIHLRMIKDIELIQYLDKYYSYPYNDRPKWVTKIKNWHSEQSDISDWMGAAFDCLSNELWNEIIRQPVKDRSGNNHLLIDCWHSDVMKS
ncbi:MAG: hypothetical protein QNL62_08910 [Gammaproteobacteria bacterium]|nr:hypothetical protein [Gammaproteobacteria bacterium]